MQTSLQNYQELLTKIRQTISATQQNIVESVNYQKVLMSWEIGKEIDSHLGGQEKAEYGKSLFLQLTKDTGIKKTSLYQMHSFYKSYPEIPTRENSLSWSHYRGLISVKNAKTRQALENLAITKSLGSDRLQQEINKRKKRQEASKKITPEITQLTAKRGNLFTYTLNEEGEIDLGFNIFLNKESAAKSKQIQFVEKSDYTYIAKLERVVDGDTLHVKLDLGFGVKHHEILRLAKINAAEGKTIEGKKATEFLKKALSKSEFLIVKTNKTDIYGRYVADVFFAENGEEKIPEKIAKEGAYLNQFLLDQQVVSLWQSN